jgi:uncharacterized membrane protein
MSGHPTRLEGFSDAVFAFALTLIVVSLEVPDTMEELEELARGFVPFALMFAMVCWVWYLHSKFFKDYSLDDAWTSFLNCILLFVVLFYVYPLKFLTSWLLGGAFGIHHPMVDTAAQKRTLMLLYSSGVVLIFGTFLLLYRHAWRNRTALGLTPLQQIELRYGTRAHFMSALVAVGSIVLVLIRVSPFYAGIVYVMMGPLHMWNGHQHSAEQKRLAAR